MVNLRAHLTALPSGFRNLRILQVLFTIVIFSLSVLMIIADGHRQYNVVMLSAVFTLLALIWIIVASYLAPRAYNYWALLAVEILTFGVWVTAFVFVTQIHPDDPLEGCDYSFDHDEYGNVTLVPDCDNQSLRRTASLFVHAVLGFAGCLVVLWLASMVVVGVFIVRHRRAGGHSKRPEQQMRSSVEHALDWP